MIHKLLHMVKWSAEFTWMEGIKGMGDGRLVGVRLVE